MEIKSVTELNTKLLSKLLSQQVESFEIHNLSDTQGFLSNRYKIDIKLIVNNDNEQDRIQIFAKESIDQANPLSEFITTNLLTKAELLFYQYAQNNSSIESTTPKCYYPLNNNIQINNDDNLILLIEYLEDFYTPQYKDGLTICEAKAILSAISKIHSIPEFWKYPNCSSVSQNNATDSHLHTFLFNEKKELQGMEEMFFGNVIYSSSHMNYIL